MMSMAPWRAAICCSREGDPGTEEEDEEEDERVEENSPPHSSSWRGLRAADGISDMRGEIGIFLV